MLNRRRMLNWLLVAIACVGLWFALNGCYGPPVAPRLPSCKDFRFVDTTARVDTVVLRGTVCVK